jgi:hypothetical protein
MFIEALTGLRLQPPEKASPVQFKVPPVFRSSTSEGGRFDLPWDVDFGL